MPGRRGVIYERGNECIGRHGGMDRFTLVISVLALIAKSIPKKLSVSQKKGWLIAHVILIIVYFSGLFGSILLATLTTFLNDSKLIYAAHFFIQYFDWFLIIPGAYGSVITGTWLATRTDSGLTKHFWVMVKWVGSIIAFLFGSSFVRIGVDDSLKNASYGSN